MNLIIFLYKHNTNDRLFFPSEFIYCGLILEDDATVESIGLKNGSMVHALQKKEPESSMLNKHISEDCILQLASAFKSFNETPAFRSALHVIKLFK